MANVTRFFLVVLVVGVLMGLAMAGTDIFNPVRSPAEAERIQSYTAWMEQQNALDYMQQRLEAKQEASYLEQADALNADHLAQLNEQERRWANMWNVVGLLLVLVLAFVLIGALIVFGLVGARRLWNSQPQVVYRFPPVEAAPVPAPVTRPPNAARQPQVMAMPPAAAQGSVAAQPSPAPATACANPPRPVNPPQPSQSPAGPNPGGPGGASPASNLPPNTAWSPDRRRDAIRQAREQEKAERMLKILIDNRMDNINNNHSRQLF